MKKVFLSILAIAAIFVACDKTYEEQIEVAGENELVLENEMSGEMQDAIVDAIVARWGAEGFEFRAPEKGAASSERNNLPECSEDTRDGQTIGGFTDYISYEITTINNNNFGVARSEADTPLASFTPLLTLYFVNGNGNTNLIYLNGAQIGSFESAGFKVLYDNSILSTPIVERLDASFIYNGDSSVGASGIECAGTSVNYGQFYTITQAPFPLTGFLATIKSASQLQSEGLTLPNPSANYAATSTSTLIQAIEADLAQ